MHLNFTTLLSLLAVYGSWVLSAHAIQITHQLEPYAKLLNIAGQHLSIVNNYLAAINHTLNGTIPVLIQPSALAALEQINVSTEQTAGETLGSVLYHLRTTIDNIKTLNMTAFSSAVGAKMDEPCNDLNFMPQIVNVTRYFESGIVAIVAYTKSNLPNVVKLFHHFQNLFLCSFSGGTKAFEAACKTVPYGGVAAPIFGETSFRDYVANVVTKRQGSAILAAWNTELNDTSKVVLTRDALSGICSLIETLNYDIENSPSPNTPHEIFPDMPFLPEKALAVSKSVMKHSITIGSLIQEYSGLAKLTEAQKSNPVSLNDVVKFADIMFSNVSTVVNEYLALRYTSGGPTDADKEGLIHACRQYDALRRYIEPTVLLPYVIELASSSAESMNIKSFRKSGYIGYLDALDNLLSVEQERLKRVAESLRDMDPKFKLAFFSSIVSIYGPEANSLVTKSLLQGNLFKIFGKLAKDLGNPKSGDEVSKELADLLAATDFDNERYARNLCYLTAIVPLVSGIAKNIATISQAMLAHQKNPPHRENKEEL
jgi:hypothetical protein